jgi:hypothetical protein
MSEDVPRYEVDIGPTTNIIRQPGCRFLRELAKGETWCVHPSGNGIVIAHPERPLIWVRVDDGDVVEEVVQPAPG